MTLPTRVIEQDNKLEKAAEGSRLKLAEYRWHWTLDESNPERVSIYRYAREIARGETTVRDMVRGYAEYLAAPRGTRTIEDALAKAKLRGETTTATEAVAKARGVSIESARRHHAEEVREVKATAQERAERRGSSVDEEISAVAAQREEFRKAAEREKAGRVKSHSHAFLRAEGKIARALQSLRSVLDDSEGVEFTDDERELLAVSMGKLRALLNLLDIRLVGKIGENIDWDAELEKLGSE
jgi:hypothetical protein